MDSRSLQPFPSTLSQFKQLSFIYDFEQNLSNIQLFGKKKSFTKQLKSATLFFNFLSYKELIRKLLLLLLL